jgi:hypothetical protein
MKLSYRGVNYDYEPALLEGADRTVVGQYRGQSFSVTYPRHIPVPQPIRALAYRGVVCRTTTESQVNSIALHKSAKAIKPACGSHLTGYTKQGWISEVESIHRQNIQTRLQHRIEVAKAREDQSLLHQLERELQQIA